jgi:methenyltetrahydrofolate cyclohydrolase
MTIADDSAPAQPGGLLRLGVQDLLDAVAARTPGPGAGAVAALVTALAAALAAMAARFADPGNPAVAELIERADRLRAVAAPLADADVKAYGDYLASARSSTAGAGTPREALDEATRVPLAVTEAAAEVAIAAAELAWSGNRRLRGDAVTAVLLSSAAATAAAVLVAENLADLPADPRLARAAALAAAARSAAARALDPYPALGE